MMRVLCIKVTTLSGVSYASVTSKLTPDSVVTYLLHDWARSLWLFCLVRHESVMIKVQYTSTDS